MTSFTKKVVAIAASAVVVAGLAAMPANAAPKAGLKIAIIPKSINNGYFTAWNKGAQKACKEIKASCKYIGPTQATGPAQIKFINQAIQQGYNAIVLSAADQNALAPALKKAKAAGICVVTSDADVTDTKTREVAVLPASSERIGAAEVDWIASQIGNKGKVANGPTEARAELINAPRPNRHPRCTGQRGRLYTTAAIIDLLVDVDLSGSHSHSYPACHPIPPGRCPLLAAFFAMQMTTR